MGNPDGNTLTTSGGVGGRAGPRTRRIADGRADLQVRQLHFTMQQLGQSPDPQVEQSQPSGSSQPNVMK